MNKTQYMAELKYKVGDRVRIKNFDWFRNEGTNMLAVYMTKYYSEVVTIKSVHNGFYRIKEDGGQYCWIDEMFECKMEEETKPKYEDEVNGEYYSTPKYLVRPSGYQFVDENGNVIEAKKIVLEKKKPKYPKTFEECVSVLMCKGGNRMPLELMNTFRKLIDARNAYWTIYGEENGLGKPWEPDWREKRYVIYRNQDDIIGGYREAGYVEHHIFEFPTKEMRDAFEENFSSDIEFCKEFL